jgi:hypothetical protein
MAEPFGELVRERIIRVIVEALVFPVSIHFGCDRARAAPEAAELGDSLVANLISR